MYDGHSTGSVQFTMDWPEGQPKMGSLVTGVSATLSLLEQPPLAHGWLSSK